MAEDDTIETIIREFFDDHIEEIERENNDYTYYKINQDDLKELIDIIKEGGY